MTAATDAFGAIAMDALHEWFPRYLVAEETNDEFDTYRVTVLDREGDTITFKADQLVWPYQDRVFMARVVITEEGASQ